MIARRRDHGICAESHAAKRRVHGICTESHAAKRAKDDEAAPAEQPAQPYTHSPSFTPPMSPAHDAPQHAACEECDSLTQLDDGYCKECWDAWEEQCEDEQCEGAQSVAESFVANVITDAIAATLVDCSECHNLVDPWLDEVQDDVCGWCRRAALREHALRKYGQCKSSGCQFALSLGGVNVRKPINDAHLASIQVMSRAIEEATGWVDDDMSIIDGHCTLMKKFARLYGMVAFLEPMVAKGIRIQLVHAKRVIVPTTWIAYDDHTGFRALAQFARMEWTNLHLKLRYGPALTRRLPEHWVFFFRNELGGENKPQIVLSAEDMGTQDFRGVDYGVSIQTYKKVDALQFVRAAIADLRRYDEPLVAGIDGEGVCRYPSTRCIIQIFIGSVSVVWPAADSGEFFDVLSECRVLLCVLGHLDGAVLNEDITPEILARDLQLLDVRGAIRGLGLNSDTKTPSLLDCYEALFPSSRYYYMKSPTMHWMCVEDKRKDGLKNCRPQGHRGGWSVWSSSSRRRQLGAAYWVYATIDAYMTQQIGRWILLQDQEPVHDVAQQYTRSTEALNVSLQNRCLPCAYLDEDAVASGSDADDGAPAVTEEM